MHKYTNVPETKKHTYQRDKISVVYASGSIVNGRGNETNIGGDSFRDVIRKERKDSTVKAIVLRVNSRGGSAIASDMIWRELELAAKDKPVIISMGNYAASGGYFIAAPGTKIIASPTTITGSIGVFGLVPNAGKLMEQKLGVTFETVETNSNSDFPSVYRPMNPVEREAMQRTVETTYTDFVSKVSAGREMTFTAVDSIAQGRVWSGSDAMRIGLVDGLGGLNSAVEEAAKMAGLEAWSLRELPVSEDPVLKILSQFGAEVKTRILRKELGEFERIFDEIREIRDISGIQARLPYFIEVH